MKNQDYNLLNQALHVPIEELALVETHIRLVSSQHAWSDVGILIDEGEKARDLITQMLAFARTNSNVDVALNPAPLIKELTPCTL